MSSTTRSLLIERAKHHDAEAFAALVESVSVRLWLFIRRTGGRALAADADADDLFQMTVDRAWRVIPEFKNEGPDSLYRWLIALARSIIANRRDYLAAKGRADVRHIDSMVEGGAAHAAFDSATSVSSLVARREEIRSLELALAAMETTDRRLIERTVLEGATLTEISAELGLPRSTVWERLTAALAELRRRGVGRTLR